MDIIKKQDLGKLIRNPEFPSVSLYMPTQRARPETKQNQIRFKNLLREAQDMLGHMGMDPGDDVLNPAWHLIKDDLFWSRQNEGFALFCSPGMFLSFRLPIRFNEQVVVTNRFHIKPILPLLGIDGTFYVMALSQGNVRVLACTRQEYEDVTPEGVPKGIAEALKYDDPQSQLQFHTGAPGVRGKRSAMFHGHGVGIDEEKENLRRYCNLIEEAVGPLLKRGNAPLVLVGVEPLLSVYRLVSHYPPLDQDIDANPNDLSNKALHQRAWEVAEPYFRSRQKRAVEDYQDIAGGSITSADLQEILLASRYGRVDTLFLNMDMTQWGVFHEETGEIESHARQEPGDQDLLDAAAFNTLTKGGIAHALSADAMPETGPVCAVFRF